MNMFEQMPFSEKYPVFRKLAEIGDLRKNVKAEYDCEIKQLAAIGISAMTDKVHVVLVQLWFY